MSPSSRGRSDRRAPQDQALRSAAELAAAGALDTAQVLRILRDAATALRATHAAGRVHGNVCAENMVLDERGAVQLRHEALPSPTPSPEQRRGERPDARADVWGLGLAGLELLPDPQRAPEPVARLLATMTADDPADRYQSTDEVLTALEACALLSGLRSPPRRHTLAVAVLALAAAMLLLALLAILGKTPPPTGTPPEAHDELKSLVERTAKSRPQPPQR